VPAKVGFKALGGDGLGVDIKGVLRDGAGVALADFSSLYAGMGSFDFTPFAGGVYSVSTEYDGIVKDYVLPSPVKGAGLSVRQEGDSIYISPRSSLGEKEARITGMSGRRLCYKAGCVLGEEIVLPKDIFPTGVARFTLFVEGEPVSERLAFIEREEDKLFIDILPDKERYGDREKVSLEIWVADSDGAPVEGSFSLAVTDDKAVTPSTAGHNIKGSLLLAAALLYV
jgi:predicted RNA-binding protein